MRKIEQISGQRWLTSVLASAVSVLVCSGTLCPTVSFTDAGELAVVATTLGIAHPTGYPLFTLLGRCTVMIPTGGEEILKLNAMAMVFVAISVGLVTQLLFLMNDAQGLFRVKRKVNLSNVSLNVIVLVSSLIFALTSTVWSQSTSVEVYSLHLIMLLLTSCAFVKGLQEQEAGSAGMSRYFVLFSFVLGLSFANHMTTILLAPAFLYLYFAISGFHRNSWIRLLKISPFFFIGLSIYVFLPIRSGMQPPLDWGHPTSLERFLWHVSGKQYQVWMFEGWAVAQKQFSYFVRHLPHEFNWLCLLFLAVGFVWLAINSKKLFAFLMLEFLSCLLYAINYEIHDIDSYFLLAYTALSCVIFFGLQQLLHLNRNKRVVIVFLYGLFVLAPVLQWTSNKVDVDESSNFLAEDAAMAVLNIVRPNSVIFTSLWDYFVSPSYYLQRVKGIRNDAVIVDEALLQNRSWYFRQLERNYPWLIERTREAYNSFLLELRKFEQGEPFNPSVIQTKWSALLRNMVDKAMVDHNVYVDGRISSEFGVEYQRIPCGLLFELRNVGHLSESIRPNLQLRKIVINSPVTDDFRKYWAFMLTQTANYWQTMDRGFSIEVLDKVLDIEPGYGPALQMKAGLLK